VRIVHVAYLELKALPFHREGNAENVQASSFSDVGLWSEKEIMKIVFTQVAFSPVILLRNTLLGPTSKRMPGIKSLYDVYFVL
jgi:hypothetical protein